MQPDRSDRGKEGLHALSKKPEHNAAQNIACSSGGQCRRRVDIDNRPAIGAMIESVRADYN